MNALACKCWKAKQEAEAEKEEESKRQSILLLEEKTKHNVKYKNGRVVNNTYVIRIEEKDESKLR